jgi:hypothetical protein
VTALVVESYFLLIWTDIVLRFRPLRSLVSARSTQAGDDLAACTRSLAEVCRAMDLACVFYPKSVRCLQRSVATCLLLSRHGIAGQIVIGVRFAPFKSHAWVEVDGIPVNDRPYMRQIYSVLEDSWGRESQQ